MNLKPESNEPFNQIYSKIQEDAERLRYTLDRVYQDTVLAYDQYAGKSQALRQSALIREGIFAQKLRNNETQVAYLDEQQFTLLQTNFITKSAKFTTTEGKKIILGQNFKPADFNRMISNRYSCNKIFYKEVRLVQPEIKVKITQELEFDCQAINKYSQNRLQKLIQSDCQEILKYQQELKQELLSCKKQLQTVTQFYEREEAQAKRILQAELKVQASILHKGVSLRAGVCAQKNTMNSHHKIMEDMHERVEKELAHAQNQVRQQLQSNRNLKERLIKQEKEERLLKAKKEKAVESYRRKMRESHELMKNSLQESAELVRQLRQKYARKKEALQAELRGTSPK